MQRVSTIELFKEYLGFSAAHFTIFSATQRERIHGHNYQVYCALTTFVGENGLSFDYRHYKQKLYALCRELNEVFLLPGHSPFLKIEETGDYAHIYFNQQKISLLKSDIKILPVVNITVEELSNWFLQHFLNEDDELKNHAIQKIEIKVSTSPGQLGSSTWEK